MFGDDIYSLGIPVPGNVADKLNQLILRIAAKEPSLGISKKLKSIISPKNEFHVTLGVFHAGVFHTNSGLFKHIIHFLRQHKQSYAQLKKSFHGNCVIHGIGYDKGNIEKSQVVWAAVKSGEVETIRTRIHELIKFSGIQEDHFKFTDPHITLFMKAGKGDIPGIRKRASESIDHIKFGFKTVAFYKRSKVILSFGPELDGKPSEKFRARLNEALKKESKGKIVYNWGNLFKDPSFDRDKALEIKHILLKEGPQGLAKSEFEKDIGKIMGLLKK